MNEEWRNLKDFDFSRYDVSNTGKIRNTDTLIELKQRTNNHLDRKSGGYCTVGIRRDSNNKKSTQQVHRLVALAFIYNYNPLVYTQVNHKDENKQNNNVDNLEWVTPQENNRYGSRLRKIGRDRRKPIVMICPKTNDIIARFESSYMASRLLGISNGNIQKCCKHEINQYYGYCWEYENVPLFRMKKLDNRAILPTKHHKSDVGLDLAVILDDDNITIQPHETVNLNTGIAMWVDPRFYIWITGRSSSNRVGLHVNAGIVDAGWTNEMLVCVTNISNEPLTINNGQRIAQAIIERNYTFDIELVEIDEFPTEAERSGGKGFGSTGGGMWDGDNNARTV